MLWGIQRGLPEATQHPSSASRASLAAEALLASETPGATRMLLLSKAPKSRTAIKLECRTGWPCYGHSNGANLYHNSTATQARTSACGTCSMEALQFGRSPQYLAAPGQVREWSSWLPGPHQSQERRLGGMHVTQSRIHYYQGLWIVVAGQNEVATGPDTLACPASSRFIPSRTCLRPSSLPRLRRAHTSLADRRSPTGVLSAQKFRLK